MAALTGATVFIGRATRVLAIGSLVAALFAILAYRKQSQEVRTLKREADERGNLIKEQTKVLKDQQEGSTPGA